MPLNFVLNTIKHPPESDHAVSYPKKIDETKFTGKYDLKISDVHEYLQMYEGITALTMRGSRHSKAIRKFTYKSRSGIGAVQ